MSGNLSGSQIVAELSRIIDSLILDNNPEVLDDDQPNLLADGDQREEAIEQLQKMIENYKENL